jgi:ribonuclease HI
MPSVKGRLSIHVDAGFRIRSPGALDGEKSVAPLGVAGLGVWIPALGMGVSLVGAAHDNNEAETLAILLGLIVGGSRGLAQPEVLSDSKASVLRFTRDAGASSAQTSHMTGVGSDKTASVVMSALVRQEATLGWRPREETTLADFFASLAMDGKCLMACTANAANPAEKFRPLLRADRRDKTPIRDVRLAWLSLPNPPKAPFDAHAIGLEGLAPGVGKLVGSALPAAELRVLVEALRRS